VDAVSEYMTRLIQQKTTNMMLSSTSLSSSSLSESSSIKTEKINHRIFNTSIDSIDNESCNHHPSLPVLSVLDVGTSSGAIMISSVLQYLYSLSGRTKEEGEEEGDRSRNIDIIGVGIDINDDALVMAVENAERLVGGTSIMYDSNGLLHDDGKVASSSSSSLSASSSSSSLKSSQFTMQSIVSQSNDIQLLFKKHDYMNLHTLSTFMQNKYNTTYEGFDIIVCNPPYLSYKANQNRITKESAIALVAGISGYEAYDDICKSIKSSYQQSKSISILKQRNGYLLFQLSAAMKAEAIVTSILKKNNFEVIICMKDHRGIPRCIVSKMR